MCTLTWWRDKNGGYGVYFNRDEKKDRPIAEAPRELCRNGVMFLSPRDPKAGGTWMLVNGYGVVICLLNKWHLGSSATKSRGKLVMGMADLSAVGLEERLLTHLTDYPPFSLFLMDKLGETIWEWNGKSLVQKTPRQPMTSSSYRYHEVAEARRAKYAEGARGSHYHGAVGEELSAYSVRMCRPDAQTWSRSRVSVGEQIEWEYLAENPGLQGEPEASFVSLDRC